MLVGGGHRDPELGRQLLGERPDIVQLVALQLLDIDSLEQDERGLRTGLGLDLTGWELFEARDISGDGLTIVGFGRNPSGDNEAWIAIIPEPGTGVLLMAGLVGLATYRRGRGVRK